MRQARIRIFESGATALIVVIFSILLLATISVGFMRLVVQDQTRSLNGELSRGAYDSAEAGVEDGKRVLETCRLDANSSACKAITDGDCDTISKAGLVVAENNEVKLKTTSGSDVSADSYDQAYTCVKIHPDTPDYVGSLAQGDSRIIPLDTIGGDNLQSLTLLWFKKAGVIGINIPNSLELPKLGSWSAKSPAVMRVELIMYKKDSYSISDFAGSASSASAGTNTIYLYPNKFGLNSTQFSRDSRNGAGNVLVATTCDGSDPVYDCKTSLTLPKPVAAKATPTGYSAYLRITSLYNASDFSVRLAAPIQFFNVQPSIDSTGRASDVFRRVNARVERINQADAQIYPRATLDVTSNVCKTFGVTDSVYVLLKNCDSTGP